MTYDPYNQNPKGDPYGQQPYGQPQYGQPQYGQQPYGPQYGYGYPPKPLDTQTAMIAMISSIAGILCCVGWIVGIVMGHVALGKIKRGEATGKGMAIAALCIGYGFIVLLVLLYSLGIGAAILENARR
ncbi:DUF4190 domain-containing protein [Lentzea sp. NPDC051838]|uniref:DUF4190 domain-containing protein n=1 Tax=Lentzea sp. NPDC051838 TaxID=3154849 RepID=UPI003434A16A